MQFCPLRHAPSELTGLLPQAMHQGVVRDIEQQRIKRERQLDFDMQRELEAEYKKVQSVRESTGEAPLPPTEGRGTPPGTGTGIGAAARR